MRGLYTSGVLDAFLEVGIQADGIVGVSAGALFGVNLPSQQPGRGLRYNKKYIGRKDYMSFWSWRHTGNFVNKEFAYYKVPLELDVFDQKTFAQSGTDFYAVATDVETGQAAYLPVKDVFKEMEILRASSALPLASEMVEWQGRKYLDGGLSDSIPVEFARQLGYDKLILVLTRPQDYRKKKSSLLPYKLIYRHYPELVSAIGNRWRQYNQTLDKVNELEEAGEIFVIRPQSDLKIGRLETKPDKLDEIYQVGLRDGQKQMGQLIAYLKEGK